jgi:uncharacterized protein (UPF0548 family)
MHVLLASRAWVSPIEAVPWLRLAPNASRDDIAEGGYLHDRYEGRVEGSFERALDRLLRYDIFPPERMRARVCGPDAFVATGVTIVQRVRFGPLALETAVRVIECEQAAEAARFAYATLEGHPERGIASFALERRASELCFIAEAWSRPGNALAQLGRPIARQLQRSITRDAITHFCASRPLTTG